MPVVAAPQRCPSPAADEDIQPLALTEQEIDDLVAFMASLTSPQSKEHGAKELARQREISRTNRPRHGASLRSETATIRAAPPVMWLYPPSLDRTRSGD